MAFDLNSKVGMINLKIEDNNARLIETIWGDDVNVICVLTDICKVPKHDIQTIFDNLKDLAYNHKLEQKAASTNSQVLESAFLRVEVNSLGDGYGKKIHGLGSEDPNIATFQCDKTFDIILIQPKCICILIHHVFFSF